MSSTEKPHVVSSGTARPIWTARSRAIQVVTESQFRRERIPGGAGTRPENASRVVVKPRCWNHLTET
jgi:hypothetical protein